MAAYLANVGANASHRARSPLYADGSFTLHPIPETRPWVQPMRLLPDVWGDRPVHLDPDLEGDQPTYGDNCRRAGRAFNLRQARPGEVIVFVARLNPCLESPSSVPPPALRATSPTKWGRAGSVPPQAHRGTSPTTCGRAAAPGPAEPGFHLVGALTVAEVKADVTADPGPGWWDGNAHVLRARAGAPWDSFWVFRGGAGTRLFERAVPFRRPEAARVFGPDWGWPEHRSELQVIASHTRAVRRLTGRAERELLRMCP
jgi:hypothetical protein